MARLLLPRWTPRQAIIRALSAVREPSVFDPKATVTPSIHIEKLHRTHNVEHSHAGNRSLIASSGHALQAQQSNSSQTYVAVSDNEIVGFYTIVAGEFSTRRPRARRQGHVPHPIPLLVLARLAVHINAQGRALVPAAP